MTEKTEARQTPLPDLLDEVPDGIVLGIPGEESMFPSYTNIPIGKLARQAAAELRRLHAENEAIHQAITDPENQPSQFGTVTFAMYEALEAQRDALLEALKWLDKWMSDKTIPQCGWKVRAAIKAVEEEA